MLREEMERVLRSHDHNIKMWCDRAENMIEGMAGGAHTYMLCQVALCWSMKAYCEQAWSSVDEWLEIGEVVEQDEPDLGDSESHIATVLGNGWD